MALLGVISAFGQDRLSPELLWELDRVGSPAVSPDGQWVAYTVTDYTIADNKGLTDIYLKPIAGGKAKKLTTEVTTSAWNPEWRPDGKKLGFISLNAGEAQLFEIEPATIDIEQITNQEGGISGFHYAASGDRLGFTANVKMEQTTQDLYPDLPMANGRVIDNLMYRHWDSWDDYHYSHIFVQSYSNGKVSGEAVDIMAGERYDAPLNPFGGSEEWAMSPDGKKVAYTCKKLSGKQYAVSTNSDIYEYNIASKKTVNLSKANKGYDKGPVYSPDGKKLAWNQMKTPGYESAKNTIIVHDFASNKSKDVFAKHDQNGEHLVWAADGGSVYLTSGVKARFHIFQLDLKKGSLKQITTGRYNYNGFGISGKTIVAHRTDMSHAAELFSVDMKKGKAKPFTQVNKAIYDKLAYANIREHWVKTTTGEKMHVWLVLPPNFDSTKTYPTLLYCQGGPQAAISNYYSFRWNFELMAAQDYIIVAPNRHGVPTFGQEWNHQISGDWGGQAMKDYLTAIDWATKLPYVNKDKLGAVGASYGGYSVYWLAGNHDKRFKCLIAHCGLYNLNSWYATTEEMFFADYDLKAAPWHDAAGPIYEKFNPANFINKWDAPILVIHGEKDFRVPIGEGLQAFNSAQLRGVESRFLYFPDEGHWVLSPQNGLLWHREYFRWLDEHLK